jgi:hypothetical protein
MSGNGYVSGSIGSADNVTGLCNLLHGMLVRRGAVYCGAVLYRWLI